MSQNLESLTTSQKLNRLDHTSKVLVQAFNVLDLWRGTGACADYGWNEFSIRLLDIWFAPEETPAPVQDILTTLCKGGGRGPTPLLFTETRASLQMRVASKTNGRTFRAVRACYPKEGETDTRVRTMLQELLLEGLPFTISALFCSAFTATEDPRSHGKARTDFNTTIPSRMEQLLYISAVAKLTTINATRPSKKRKRNDNRVESVENALNWKEDAQKVGYAIQKIVTAWNHFAAELGFSDIDELVRPYVRIVSPMAQFEVIRGREQGFPPLSQSRILKMDVALTCEMSETFGEAFDRPADVDSALRVISADFLQDIDSAVQSRDLHNADTSSQVEFLKKFATLGRRSLPTRFGEYDEAQVARISNHRNGERGTQDGDNADEDVIMATTKGPPPLEQHPTAALVSSFAIPNAPAWVAGSLSETPASSGGQQVSCPDEKLLEQSRTILFNEMQKGPVRMYPDDFEHFLANYDVLAQDSDLEGNVQLILTDPPYNTRRNSGKKHAEYDLLEDKDYDRFVDFVAEVLRPGGHAIIFCSNHQFYEWYKRFSTFKDTDSEKPMFMVDRTPMNFLYHPSVHNKHPGRKSCALSNRMEYAVHMKRNGLTLDKECEMVNYRSFGFVPSTYSPFTNVISNIMGWMRGERVTVPVEPEIRDIIQPGDGNSDADSERDQGKRTWRYLRPEQKCISLCQELIARFSQPGDIVLDCFAGTFSTAIACFTLPQPRIFVGCEKDIDCFVHAKKRVVETFATALVTGQTKVSVLEEPLEAARIIDNCRGRISKRDNWKPPAGLPPYQDFPRHILSHLASIWNCPGFVGAAEGIPWNEWDRKYQGLFHQLDPTALRYIDAAASGIYVADSTVRHRNAGLGVFAGRTFQPHERICYFYGTLTYHDLMAETSKLKMYGEGFMSTTRERFEKTCMLVPVYGSAFDGVRQTIDGHKSVCIVPAPFCVAGFINDYRYHTHDEEYDAYIHGRLEHARQPNVSYRTPSRQKVSSGTTLQKCTLMAVYAIDLIHVGQELFANYGKEEFVPQFNSVKESRVSKKK